jgi:hypothetical protein
MPRFVLLEHHWDGVHWDFMLEVGETLRTWALGAPPTGPDRVIPARALADHRLAYLDYEGEISGGRGSVHRLDSGTYEARVWTPGLILVHLDGGRLQGEAELRVQETGGAASSLSWTFGLIGNVD